MNDEKKKQYLIASTNLATLKRKLRNGKATDEQVAEAERILAGIVNASAEVFIEKPKEIEIKKVFSDGENVLLSPEAKAQIDALKLQRSEVDKQKAALSNRLVQADRNSLQSALVRDIKALREKWLRIGDEIISIYRLGVSPPMDDGGAFRASLPLDKYELQKKLQNRRADLSKHKKRLATAKDESTKIRQEKQIAKAIFEISEIETLLRT